MKEALRKSWPARAAAVGFILLIIFGNLWAGMVVVNAHAPDWVSYGFGAGLIIALVAGVALGGLALYLRFFAPPETIPETIDE